MLIDELHGHPTAKGNGQRWSPCETVGVGMGAPTLLFIALDRTIPRGRGRCRPGRDLESAPDLLPYGKWVLRHRMRGRWPSRAGCGVLIGYVMLPEHKQWTKLLS